LGTHEDGVRTADLACALAGGTARLIAVDCASAPEGANVAVIKRIPTASPVRLAAMRLRGKIIAFKPLH
jgi:hypothetical protein